jgi:DNA polymerase elongation subunit (family B)
MSYINLFYIDIETASKYKNLDEFRKNEPIGFELFEKKHSKRRKTRPEWDVDINQAYFEQTPLIPEYGKIICVSCGRYVFDDKNNTYELKIANFYSDDEYEILKKTKNALNYAEKNILNISGYNIKNFDMPYLFKKFYMHKLDVPKIINFDGKKPWDLPIKDIFDFYKNGAQDYATLEEVCYVLGIKYLKDISGDKINENYWNGNLMEIVKHCEEDILNTAKIAEILLKD